MEKEVQSYAKEYGNDTELRCSKHGQNIRKHKFSM